MASAQEPDLRKPRYRQVVAKLVERERPAPGCVDQHVDREQRAGFRTRAGCIHNDVTDQNQSAGLKRREHLCEQSPVLRPRVLVDDRAYPGQVRALRQRVFHKVTRKQPHPVRKPCFLHQPLSHGYDLGPVHNGRAGFGVELEEGLCPRARSAAQIQNMREFEFAEVGDKRHCQGPGYLVHGADE
ncbi:MAG TPA: hypothetical protein PL016_00230 [Kiritimatiellia bacterium]|nr:hypothetical protein [Kiritimatiellia bacterium]